MHSKRLFVCILLMLQQFAVAAQDVNPRSVRMWGEGVIEVTLIRPKFIAADVDVVAHTVVSDFGDKVQAAVLNVIPPQRAGNIAAQAGLANMNQRWCEVDFRMFESTRARNIHVLGDAIQIAPLMPNRATWRTSTARYARRQ